MHQVMTIEYWREQSTDRLNQTLAFWNGLGSYMDKKRDLIKQVLIERELGDSSL